MIDRLYRMLERIEQLPAEMQNEVAEQLADWVMPFDNLKEATTQHAHPKSLAGAWADLPDADEMIDELDRLRHLISPLPSRSTPT